VLDRPTARIASYWLSIGLPFLYFLTSIAFYLHTYDSAQVKITIVQCLGTVLIGLWYVRLLTGQENDWRKYLPFAVPLIASLISGVVSWLHTDFKPANVDETLRRVFYIHFALIALTEINTEQRFKLLLKFLLAATVVSAGYGMVQFLDWKFFLAPFHSSGLDPFIWRQAFASRVFSTFGNPNFFGNFLVILTPITLALILKRNTDKPGSILLFAFMSMLASAILWHSDDVVRLLRVPAWDDAFFVIGLLGFCFWAALRFSWLGVLFFLITFCTIITASKGAWVGYAGAFISFLGLVVFYFSQFQSENVRRIVKWVAMGFLLVAIVGVGVYSGKRIDSLRFRVFTWVSNWEMTQMHPFWGNGVGSFRVIYPAFRRPQIFHIEGKHNTETDHAENEYFEVLMDEGILGFGIFIWILTLFSITGLRALGRFTEGVATRDPTTGRHRLTDDPRAYYMLGLIAAFWGMLMHNLMDVSLRFVSSGIFLWLLVGLIGAIVVHDPWGRQDPLPEEPVRNPQDAGLLVPAWFITAGVLGFLIMQIYTGFKDVQGPYQGPSGEILLWSIAWLAFSITVGGCAYAIYQVARSMKHVYGFIVLLVVLFYPLKTFWGYFMADAHHNRGIFHSKQGQWEQAIDNYRRVVTLNPGYLMAYYFTGNVYTDRWGPGDVDRSMEEYARLWKLAPNYVQSHHQAGLVYLKKGQDSRARGDIASAKAEWTKAITFFEKYHSIDPVFEGNYARKAWVHLQLAELAAAEGRQDEVQRQHDAAERCYKESLEAWGCRLPEHNILKEHWDRSHRHYDYGYSAEMWANLGNVRLIRNRPVDAVRAYRMSVQKNPDNVMTLKNLALAYTRMGRQYETLQTWNRIRQLAPQDPDVLRIFHGQPAPKRP